MIRLLDAGFTRLKKSKVFLLICLFSIGFALFMLGVSYKDMKQYQEVINVAQLLLNYSTMIGVVIAIFTSLFLGVEYSEGAIRNKISMGHKRTAIYLSNLILTSITSVFAYLLFMLVVGMIGIPLFGGITAPILMLVKVLGCILVAIVAYSSLFTFIAMMISNKTVMAITSIMVVFLMMMGSLTCLDILGMPKTIQTTTILNQETNEFKIEEMPNPKYPSATERKVYQTLLDINPAGQMFQLAGRTVPNLKALPLYSLGILIVFTGGGLALFKKKELK